MTGMGGGPSAPDPAIVSAFHRALLHQGLVAIGLAVAVLVAWNVLRGIQLRRATAMTGTEAGEPAETAGTARPAEPVARRLLRVGFGLLWVFDGILQGQASMPGGLIPQVVRPAASTSPGWVQHLVQNGSSVWQSHPVTAAAAAVWIQVGIGLWLLVAPPGRWSRLAGLAGAARGLVVWVFGEAFGGIFAPGLTWLFGAPGAALLYALAGALVALPDQAWATARLGRVMLRGAGLFLAGMAILQAWPGRGFWRGRSHGAGVPGTLTAMVQQMSHTPQPHPIRSIVSAFAGFDAAHGWAVNLFAVVATLAIGAAFLTARPPIVRPALIAAAVVGLADWLLIEDLGFLGGVGTDPNSMIPLLLLFAAGWLALTRPAPAPAGAETPVAKAAGGWAQRFLADPAYALRAVAGMAAIGLTLLGAAPMAIAAVDRTSDPTAGPIVTSAGDRPVNRADSPALRFQLVARIPERSGP